MCVCVYVCTGPSDRAQSLDGDLAVARRDEQMELQQTPPTHPPAPAPAPAQDTELKEGTRDQQGVNGPGPSQSASRGERTQVQVVSSEHVGNDTYNMITPLVND